MDNRHISLVFSVAVATAFAMLLLLAACGRGDQEEWRFFDSPDGGSEEIPEPRDGEFFDEPGDGSSSSSSGSSIPLNASDVSDFSGRAHINLDGSAEQIEAANRALDRAIDSGQQVIVCQYGPSDPEAQTGYTNYGFWYEDVPDNIDELLLVARDIGIPKTVSSMGTNAISSCPDSRDEGKAVWLEDYPDLGTTGVVTLEFGDIKTRIWDQQCGEGANIWVSLPDCITQWELDIVFEATSDVGATITQGQMCYIWTDGKLFGNRAFGTACGDPFELEYRIDPDRAFSRHVSGPDLGGEKAVVLKYWGTDDGGNAIYLERALSVHTTKFGLNIVDRSQYWLADRPYKEWR